MYDKILIMFAIEKFDLLISFYIVCIALSELMGAKTFPLANIFGYQLNASVAVLILPIVYAINDVITEVHGKKRARSVVRSGLLIVAFILLFSLLSTALPASSRFKDTEPAYESIFGLSARISASSLTAFTIAEFLDVYIFAKLRQSFGRKKLWLRTNISNFVSQLLDTVIFMTLAFYALDKSILNNLNFLASIILPYWLLKCSMSVIETPLVYAGVHWLKRDTQT